jgi:photosystem II stability/assembly factor-like uncharacterized protein
MKKLAKFCAIALAICVSSPISASGYGTKLDNGRNWFKLNNAVAGGGATGMAVSGDGNYVYALEDRNVRVSSDGGATWRDSNTNLDLTLSLADIAASNTGQYVVVTQNGGIIQMSNDFGRSWSPVAGVPGPDPNYPYNGGYRVAMSSSGQYVASLLSGLGVLWSSNYGASFTLRSFPPGTNQTADVAISGDGRKVFVPDHNTGRLLLANGYTASFQAIAGAPSEIWGPVAISGDGNTLMAAISYGGISVSRDGGATWNLSVVVKERVDDGNYTAATMSYDGKFIGVARGGSTLLTSSDSGYNWEARPGSGINIWTGISSTQDGMTMYANMSGVEVWKSLPSWIWYDNGTVSFFLPECGADTSADTSIAAASVALVVDTMTAATQSDGATYVYFTETDTALWGATYNYGQERDPICQYSNLSGSVIITRDRFISSTPAFSETTTNTVDFIQFVGGTHSGGQYSGSPCGNLGVRHAASVTQSCSPGILADYQQLSQFGMVDWRDQGLTSGIRGQQSGNAYVAVKIKRSAIRGAPTGSTWSATETFTLTSV